MSFETSNRRERRRLLAGRTREARISDMNGRVRVWQQTYRAWFRYRGGI